MMPASESVKNGDPGLTAKSAGLHSSTSVEHIPMIHCAQTLPQLLITPHELDGPILQCHQPQLYYDYCQ